MKLKKLAVLIPLLYATSAAAIEPFVVKDIRVEGLQRTEAGTVFSYLPVKVGDTLDDDHAAAAIHALYATGFFKDVSLEEEKGVLVVLLHERPAIASIEINGTKDFPKDQLKEGFKSAGLAEGRIFDRSALDKAVQELKRQYVAHGKYGVSVKTDIENLERNRVKITFNVIEGEPSTIKAINFIGNHAYSESDLKDLMKLDTHNWMSWFSHSNQYSRQKLSADLETIRSFYLDSGYLEFSLDSTQISITPDKKDIYITINITEGSKYTITDVKFLGPEKILPVDEMKKLSIVKPGQVFARKDLTATSTKITDRLGEDGYAFANVNAVPELDKEKHQAIFTFMVDPGHRVYVRHVNISGNDKTSDQVIRREFRQMEGGWFVASKIKKSKQRVDRLDFFSEVNIETPTVPGTDDQVDVNMNVKEKSTGDFSIGAGVASGQGLILTGAITQRNLFGTGKYLSTQISTSKINQVYSVSYTDPYYTPDGVSRGLNVYDRRTNAAYTVLSPYTANTMGAGVNYGVPVTEDDTIRYGLAVERTSLGLTELSSWRYVDFVNRFGDLSTNLIGSAGWSRDTRDSVIDTREGTLQSFGTEVAAPLTNESYYKMDYRRQWFYPVSRELTLALNGEGGVAHGMDGKPLPFFKNFYAGGPGSVRGYSPYSIGPRDVNNNALGGSKRVIGNAELLFPMPGMAKDPSVRLSAFVDAGAVYGSSDLPDSSAMRYSTGLAFTWISPVGPIKLSYGKAIRPVYYDDLQKFQFTLGNIF